MLYPCEMAHCKCNLAVNSPYDTREHCSAQSSQVSCLTIRTEGLIVEEDNIEEENDEGRVDTIAKPSEYSMPVEEQVFRPLLVQSWKLQKNLADMNSFQSERGW